MDATHKFEQEVRIAVVMYGGVSLAIYMNGVTQELLHLVRATAPAMDRSSKLLHQKAESTESVYRELACMLQPSDGTLDPARAGRDQPVRTRFVIDLLSGTSAGGINAIFLAKALALDQKLDRVRELWMTEAGIENLINDKKSVERPLTSQTPPEALLNGERLYLKLLGAFDEMDREGQRDRSPYVDDAIDLFVTATDIVGLGLPLRLQFQQVEERRHKNVFHVQYRAMPDEKSAPCAQQAWPIPANLSLGENEFADTNPFLAFAARCTSSFPFAFEPMTLERAVSLCQAAGKKIDVPYIEQHFFEDYVEAAAFNPLGNALAYDKVPFGDGGYLDNKPFGPVIDALGGRAASLPAVRKLLYIEPSPEHHTPLPDPKVTFVDNVVAAAFTLPTYETIREDVRRISDRNRLVERVRRINAFVEDDLNSWTTAERSGWRVLASEDWRLATGAQMVAHYGPGFGGYQRLRVSSAADELAGMITRAAGLGRTTNNFLVVRELIRAWRNLTYEDKAPGEGTYNAFLFKFDMQYLLRRLTFVRTRLNEMASGDKWSRELCKRLDAQWPSAPTPEFVDEFINELTRLKSEFAYLYRRLEREFERLAEKGGVVAQAVLGDESGSGQAPFGIDARILESLRAEPTEASLQRRSADLVRNLQDDFAEVDKRIAAAIADIVKDYQKAYDATRDSANEASASTPGARSARAIANGLYDKFEAYDLLSFPVLATSDIGEPVRADIIRISPMEPSVLGGPPDNPRLAGTKLFSFGAFIERHWRENDMLWGRLQGAEQIITCLLPRIPDEPADRSAARARLIKEAHLTILKDMIDMTSVDVVGRMIRHALTHAEKTRTKGYVGPPIDVAGLSQLFQNCLTPELLREHYEKFFQLDDSINPPGALRAAARSSVVVGQMLDGVTDKVKPVTGWLIRAGRMLWGTVEVSIPHSFWRRVFHHWSAVLLICAALLIVVGTLADIAEAPRVGWLVVILVTGANIASSFLKWFFQGRFWLLRLMLVLVGLGLLGLAVYGARMIWSDVAALMARWMPW